MTIEELLKNENKTFRLERPNFDLRLVWSYSYWIVYNNDYDWNFDDFDNTLSFFINYGDKNENFPV